MDCSICGRIHDADKLPFLCAVDARNAVYELRMRSVQHILEIESLRNSVKDQTTKYPRTCRVATEQAKSQHQSAEDRTDVILAAAERLESQIREARDKIRNQKAALAQRRAAMTSGRTDLVQRSVSEEQQLDKSVRTTNFQWAQKTETTAHTRAFLCSEAVKLYGLKRSKKGSPGRYEYTLGRVPIVDLTGMDSSTPEIISTSLAHIAHILVLVCHYLSIRLPAEITLPHRDYPRPTIFDLGSSYRRHPAVYQGPSSQLSVSRSSDSQRISRPKPLSVDKPLTQLAKEEPLAYSSFIEGVTLLAYNIAWLCCCQGVDIGETSEFEDICHMGRNLHSFLISAQSHDFNPINVKAPLFPGDERAEGRHVNWLGRYSHDGIFYNLISPEGVELVKSFKLPTPMKLADRLRDKLIGDGPTPDWEVLDVDECKIEQVPVNTAESQPKGNLQSKAPATSLQRPGVNGWTKVKQR